MSNLQSLNSAINTYFAQFSGMKLFCKCYLLKPLLARFLRRIDKVFQLRFQKLRRNAAKGCCLVVLTAKQSPYPVVNWLGAFTQNTYQASFRSSSDVFTSFNPEIAAEPLGVACSLSALLLFGLSVPAIAD